MLKEQLISKYYQLENSIPKKRYEELRLTNLNHKKQLSKKI
jgi:hypothetical protein